VRRRTRRFLIRAGNSLLSREKIPVPSSRDFAVQNIENAWKIWTENRSEGAFSCKIPVKIPVSRDLLRGFRGAPGLVDPSQA
jgi:hypothetical protein